MRSQKKGVMTIGKRSNMLHGPSSGDLLFRWFGAALIGICLVLSIYGTFIFISGVFLLDWSQGPFMVQFCLPVAMWMTALYFTVVRYLTYLDIRIRQEGWEVEFALQVGCNLMGFQGRRITRYVKEVRKKMPKEKVEKQSRVNETAKSSDDDL